MARRPLWEVGQDFGHGLGHSVSHCGPVHEYPHFAFARDKDQPWSLEPGMTITNEPGFYKQGAYGIRIENLLHVAESENDFLCFENMTFVPYCKELIERDLLLPNHVKELKKYYEQIGERVMPVLAKADDKYGSQYLEEQLRAFI